MGMPGVFFMTLRHFIFGRTQTKNC